MKAGVRGVVYRSKPRYLQTFSGYDQGPNMWFFLKKENVNVSSHFYTIEYSA